jgi:DUF4097 and DUF4098 domain-containing protein YvlB
MKSAALLFFTLLPIVAIAGTYQETRNLEIPAAGIVEMQLHAGAGSLSIAGIDGHDKIEVTAEIEAQGTDRNGFRLLADKLIQLELVKEYNRARLFSQNLTPPSGKISTRIHLVIQIPAKMNLRISDGSGAIDIMNIVGNLSIDDDSGAIRVRNIKGRILIEDGSGDIEVEDVQGNLEIIDGSGQMVLQHVSGDLTITDASGSIEVNDIGGNVTVTDGSGNIDIYRVQKNVFIREPGSGGIDIDGVQGKVIIRE